MGEVASQQWRANNPERAAEYSTASPRASCPPGWEEQLPVFEPGKSVATRAASGKVLQALGAVIPELWGGSADLAGSNNTTIDKTSSFLPEGNPLPEASPYGRTVHFGIREHSMAAEMNGIALHGNTRIYGGTFLVFSDYMRNAVRLSALMHAPGDVRLDARLHRPRRGRPDPPAGRAPRVAARHPGPERGPPGRRQRDRDRLARDPQALARKVFGKGAPHGLVLTRQGVPTYEPNEDAAKGGYVLFEASTGTPEVDPHRDRLRGARSPSRRASGWRPRACRTRVVSMPSVEWFEEQDQEYRDSVLPPSVKARVAVEAGIGLTWHSYVGDAGRIVSLEHFGASADGKVLFQEYGFTAENVAAKARESLAAAAALTLTYDRRRCNSMTDALKRLSEEGVAIWLDDLSRKRITSGNLAELIDQQHVVGVTTNPSIFQKAISQGDGYDQQLADLAARKVTVEEAIRMITTADVRDAADILRPVFDATGGQDGRVSIEVDPRLAHHTTADGRRGQAARLAGRPPQHADQDPGDEGRACRPSPRSSASASASTSR